MNNNFKIITTVAAILAALNTIVGFAIKPILEDYIHDEIQVFENNNKEKTFEEKIAPKMGVDADEVHIEMGKHYKNDEDIKKEINKIKKEIKYYHPSTILK